MTRRPAPLSRPAAPLALARVAGALVVAGALGVACLAAGASLLVAPARADGPACLAPDEARRAVAAGGLVSASEAMRAARGGRGVEVLGARLCEEAGGGHAYHLTLLHRDGRVERLSVDARTGAAR